MSCTNCLPDGNGGIVHIIGLGERCLCGERLAHSSRTSEKGAQSSDIVEQIASFVEHLRDDYQSTAEPVAKVARLIREKFGSEAP